MTDFYPENYGAIGDGITDDTAAFQAMNSDMQGLDKARIILEAGKTYRYTWNKWASGVKDLEISGNGAKLLNVFSGSYAVDMYPLFVAWDARPNRTIYYGPQGVYEGSLIDSVGPGSNVIKLKTPEESLGFEVGKWVLVSSFDRQYQGYPPNQAYWDFAKVLSISGGTIALDRTITCQHNDNYPETKFFTPMAYGKARIRNLERGEYNIMHRAYLHDFEVLDNPALASSPSSQYLLTSEILDVRMERVKVSVHVPSVGIKTVVDDCEFKFVEVDKLLDYVEYRNTPIGDAGMHGGSAKQIMINGGIVKGPIALGPDMLTVQNTALMNATATGGFHNIITSHSKVINILNNRIMGKNNPTDNLFAPSAVTTSNNTGMGFIALAEGQYDGAILTIDLTKQSTFARSLRVGTILHKVVNGSSFVVPTGITGKITLIVGEGDNLLAGVVFNGPVSTGDKISYTSIDRLNVSGNQPINMSNVSNMWTNETEPITLYLRPGETTPLVWIGKIITKIEVSVIKADTGTLLVRGYAPVYGTPTLNFSLSQSGSREVSLFNAHGKTGDTISILPESVTGQLDIRLPAGHKAEVIIKVW